MPSAVIVQIQPRRSVARPAFLAAGAVVAAVLIWVVLGVTGSPSTVPRVTVVNPSTVDVELAVSSARGATELDLGHLTPGSSRAFRDVLDQGSTWVFDVSAPIGRLGRLEFDRDELVRGDWTIRLPAGLSDVLAR